MKVPCTLHPGQDFITVFFLMTAILYLIAVFICMCVMINAVEHLFKCLLNIHVSSLGQCPVVHSLSSVRPFMTPWTAGSRASLFFTICQSLLKPLSNEPKMPSNHLTLCLSSSPPALSISQSGSFPVSCYWHQEAKVLELLVQHRSFQ